MALTTATQNQLYQFFAIAFDAAPGVTYMSQLTDAVNAGMTVPDIVEVFTTKTQFTSVYPNFYTSNQFATKLIDNVVGNSAAATAKAAAVADVEAALTAGWSRGQVVYQIFSNLAAKPETDATWGNTAKMMANQVAVAKYVTETQLVDTVDLTTLKGFLANVTAASDVSTPAAIQAITGAATSAAIPGQTFTLTAGADTLSPTSGDAAFKTTAGDDTIRAVVANSLETIDFIDGGDGNDTLTIGAFDNTAAPVIKNVETIYLRADTNADEFFATDVTGAKTIIVEGTDAAGTDFHTVVSNIALGTAIAVKNQEANVDFDFAAATGGADAASLDVFDFGAAAGTDTLTIDEIETLTINVSGTSQFTIASAAELETLNITGSKALTLDAAAATADLLTTIDGSAATGALTIDADAGAAAVTVKGGSGADTITVDGTFADQLTGNGGADTFVIAATAGGNITAVPTTVSALNKLLVTVTDFAGADTLDLSGIVGAGAEVALSGTELAAIADTSVNKTLLDAIAMAAGFAGNADDVVTFQYGSDTYVYVDEGGNGALTVNDTLIKLTGVSSVAADDIVI